MALPIRHANSRRCVAIAVGLIALSVFLQCLSALVWADPASSRAVLEFLYSGRGAVLQALHVMALTLLTIGVFRITETSAICAAWVAAACLLEFAQHPAVAIRLLQWAEESPLPSRMLDATVGHLLNARFARSEIVASIVGGVAAWALARREFHR